MFIHERLAFFKIKSLQWKQVAFRKIYGSAKFQDVIKKYKKKTATKQQTK